MRITGGEARGRRLRGPRDSQTRPTADRVREAIFDILGPRISGSSFLDIFAGTGAVGIEALSRGASRVVFLESRPANLVLIGDNLLLGEWSGKCEVIDGDAGRAIGALRRRGDEFDVVFLDPPYDRPDVAVTVAASATLLAAGGRLLVEHRSSQAPPGAPSLKLRKAYPHGDTTLSLFLADPAGRDAAAGSVPGPAAGE
jgi:16S rRNA (guanine966-N2)-methyltransferase